jgi:hypothetical protein
MAHRLLDKRMGLALEGLLFPWAAAGEGFTEDLLVDAILVETEVIMAVVVVIEAVEVGGSEMVQTITDGVGTMTIGERHRRGRDGADEIACRHKII